MLQTPSRDENPAAASSLTLLDKSFHYHMRENLTYKEKYTMQEETIQFTRQAFHAPSLMPRGSALRCYHIASRKSRPVKRAFETG
jgi:hypothetical protein